MEMRIVCSEQRTPQWYQSRLGIPTASSAWRCMKFSSKGSKVRGDKRIESSATREAYKLELAIEIITGMPAEHFVSKPMDFGTQYEPKARSEYMFLNDIDGNTTGFVLHPSMDRFGCSPDLLLVPGAAEFKVPLPTTHAESLRLWWNAKKSGLTGNDLALAVIPEEDKKGYQTQCFSIMACCELEWIDWVSFAAPDPDSGHPLFPENLRLLQVRLHRDEERIKAIEEGVQQFNEELLELVEDMRQMHNGALPGSKLHQQLKESL